MLAKQTFPNYVKRLLYDNSLLDGVIFSQITNKMMDSALEFRAIFIAGSNGRCGGAC